MFKRGRTINTQKKANVYWAVWWREKQGRAGASESGGSGWGEGGVAPFRGALGEAPLPVVFHAYPG